VECAGRLHLARGATFAAAKGSLTASPAGDGAWLQVSCRVELEEGSASFRLVGLPPGKYRVLLWGGDDMLHTSFELPASGDGALELTFDGGDGGR
jgi:hypothetical protein